jgi:hypothetical protein
MNEETAMTERELDFFERLIQERRAKASVAAEIAKPTKSPSRAEEEKFTQLRTLFDEKYRISTPTELLRY